MRYWKQALTLVLVFAMLAGFMVPVAAEIYDTISLNEAIPVQVTWEEPKTFAFVPEEDGYYSFFSQNYTGDPETYIYDADMNELAYDDDSGYDRNFYVLWYAAAGETYYLRAAGDGDYTVRVEKRPVAESLVLDRNSIQGDCVVNKHTALYATGYPEDAYLGEVTWSSSDETVATVDDNGEVVLRAPGTAIITATSEFGLTDTCTVTVRELETVLCDETVTVPEGEERHVRRFVPETDGWYGFYSQNDSIDSWGWILDEAGNELAYDDYCGNGVEFLASAQLQAGKTYYLSAQWSDNQWNRTVDLQVTKLTAPSVIDVYETSLTGYPGFRLWLDYEYVPVISIPETVTWSSSDESVVSVNEDGKVTFVSAGSAVITVTSQSGLTDTVNVTVREAQQVVCGEIIQVTEFDNPLYMFIPETDGYYGFYSTGDQGDPRGIILSSEQDWVASNYENGIDRNFLVKAYLTAGAVYYLDAGWTSHSTGESYEARIEPLGAATGLQLSEQSVSSPKGSRFNLSVNTVPFLAVSGNITWSSSDDSVATWDYRNDGIEVVCRDLGTAVITATSEDGLTASCTVTVTSVPGIELDEIVTVNAADGEQRFAFTPEQDGWYAFFSQGDNLDTWGSIYSENGDHLESDDDNGDANHFCVLQYMTAGETYYLESGTYGDEIENKDYQIQVTVPPEATGLELSSTRLTGFVGDTNGLEASLLPEMAKPQNITWSSSDTNVVTVNEYGAVYMNNAGTATVTATSDSDLTASCQVTVKEILDIHCGESVTLNEGDGRQIFRFVPEVTGSYWFYSTGDDADPWGQIYDYDWNYLASNNDGGKGVNFSTYAVLTEGQTYYLEAESEYSEGTETYTVHLERALDATGIQLSETSVAGAPGDYFNLDAFLLPENAAPQNLTWTSSNEMVAEVYGGEVSLLGEGEAVITVTTESGLTASCTVSSKYPQSQPIQCDQPFTVTENEGDLWFHFEPQTTGWYRFFSQGCDMDPCVYLYDQDRNQLDGADDNGENLHFILTYEMTAGQRYYLRVKFYDAWGEDLCTLKMERLTQPTGVAFENPTVSGYVGQWIYPECHVMPENALPMLTWSSSNESVALVNEYGEVELVGLGSATITATTVNGWKATCTVNVIEPECIYAGDPVQLNGADGVAKFRFVPEQDGWYGFYTTGNLDTYGFLEDANRDYVDEDDDSGQGYNYLMRAELKAGQVYYVSSSFYENTARNETYELHVDRLQQPQQIVAEDDERMLYPGYGFGLECNFLPFPSHTESVTWTSSDENVVVIEDGEYAYGQAPGTAVITATSESGLTATITVVVAEPPANADAYGRCGPNLLWYVVDGVLTVTGSGDMYTEYEFGAAATQVRLPEGLTGIAAYAFWGMDMESITIPASVKVIRNGAFGDSELKEIRFLGNAPTLEKYIFQRVTATAYYPANDPSWTEEVRQNYGGDITWVPEGGSASDGVTVSGGFTTGAEGTVTLGLVGNGTVVTATASGKTGSYRFANVTPGTYTLRVSKLNHVTREYTVTVGTTALTQDVKIHLIGDIDGNGKVNTGDVAKLNAHLRGTNVLTDEYQLMCANVNGGSLNMGDTAALYGHIKGTRTLY